MRKRLAITKDGRVSYCRSPESKMGRGRCNHVAVYEENESQSIVNSKVPKALGKPELTDKEQAAKERIANMSEAEKLKLVDEGKDEDAICYMAEKGDYEKLSTRQATGRAIGKGLYGEGKRDHKLLNRSPQESLAKQKKDSVKADKISKMHQEVYGKDDFGNTLDDREGKAIPKSEAKRIIESGTDEEKISVIFSKGYPNNLSKDLMLKISDDKSDNVRRLAGYTYSKVDEDVAKKLSDDKSPEVRKMVVQMTPFKEVVQGMLKDRSPIVKSIANERLASSLEGWK